MYQSLLCIALDLEFWSAITAPTSGSHFCLSRAYVGIVCLFPKTESLWGHKLTPHIRKKNGYFAQIQTTI